MVGRGRLFPKQKPLGEKISEEESFDRIRSVSFRSISSQTEIDKVRFQDIMEKMEKMQNDNYEEKYTELMKSLKAMFEVGF